MELDDNALPLTGELAVPPP